MSSDTSLIFNFTRGRDTVSPHLATVVARVTAADQALRHNNDEVTRNSQRTSREVFKIDNAFRGVARRWASMIALIGMLIVALLGHAVAFTQAVWQIVGVLAAVPAVSFAAAAGLGTLLLIFKNLFAALKPSGGGGASAVDQLAQATHRYEVAQRSATDAQRALNEAREQATRAIQDMDRELRKANLDERSGILAVRDARNELRRVRMTGGTRDEREAAQINYEQAVISLDEIRERNADLAKTEAERVAKGVEGSDEVQTALERQKDALFELAEAQKALAKGAGGGGGGAGVREAVRRRQGPG